MTRVRAIYESESLPLDICAIIAEYAPGLARTALDKTMSMINSKYDRDSIIRADRDIYIKRYESSDLVRISSYKTGRGWDGVNVDINKLYWLLRSRKLRRLTFRIDGFNKTLGAIEDLFHENLQVV